VNKDHTRALPEDLKNTLVDDIIQDQVSSLTPPPPPWPTGCWTPPECFTCPRS
jgi:hypothetical protein